jgi:hypothetical protein
MDYTDLKQGFEGERVIRDLLKKHRHEFGQIDLISIDKSNGKIYLWEVKHQERFKAPPFDGHGLPPWQFDFRLKVARKTNTIPMLIIVEPSGEIFKENLIFYQSLFALEKLPPEDVFLTKTGKRIVFNISAFKKLEI